MTIIPADAPLGDRIQEFRNYRRVISEYPIPHTVPCEVTEIWIELCAIAEAADKLFDFLWNDRTTIKPSRELQEAGYAAIESAADHERLEILEVSLGKKLGRVG